MSDKESLGHTFLRRLSAVSISSVLGRSERRLPRTEGGRITGADLTDSLVEGDPTHRYPVQEPSRRTPNSEPEMVDPSDVHTSEAVRRSADERIRREAIRQLDSIDLDSDEGRIEPLPAFESSGLFADVVVEDQEGSGDEVAWDEVAGRFAPEDDVSHRR